VANFVGQSNLITGDVVGTVGSRLVVDIQGTRVAVESARAAVRHGRVWVGVRPEKFAVADASPAAAAADTPAGETNTLEGGIVSDVSFVGVSTQYLVRMPWGQELTVFEQNTGERKPFAPGMPVRLRWRPSHVFLLDHAQDALAGVERTDSRGAEGPGDPGADR
jgi:spermidine/putrescine transport system ATP-binding protein